MRLDCHYNKVYSLLKLKHRNISTYFQVRLFQLNMLGQSKYVNNSKDIKHRPPGIPKRQNDTYVKENNCVKMWESYGILFSPAIDCSVFLSFFVYLRQYIVSNFNILHL